MHALERALGAIGGASGPLFIVLAGLQSSTSTSCTYSRCVTSTGSAWAREPVTILLNVVLALGLGAGIAVLVWMHARSETPGLLFGMWAACALFVSMTLVFAFLPLGGAAFFFAAFMLLAAVTGSWVQMKGNAWSRRQPAP